MTVKSCSIVAEDSRQAKVCDLELPSATDEQIRWLEVAVHDVVVVTKRHAFQQHQHVTLYLHTGTIIQSHLAMNANVRPVLLKSKVYKIWSARRWYKSKDIWDYCLT